MLTSSHPDASTIVIAPSITDVKRIAVIADPVLRNLNITQCYCELSAAFSKRTGSLANWCSYATWASKQAGQTIRSEDLKRTLEALLKKQAGVDEALSLILFIANRFGAKQSIELLHECSVVIMVNDVAKRAADAVSRGNKKVFEEIAFEFARFIAECVHDVDYSQQNIDRFCESLRPDAPPDGQEYLRQAFRAYYQSFFESDAKKKTEACFLGNLLIGFHEQNRLQPEIAEALNAAMANTKGVKDQLLTAIFKEAGFLTRVRLFFQRLFGRTALLDKAVEDLILQIQLHLRTAITAHLMTLTMPPDNRLQLGKDLSMVYHNDMRAFSNTALLQLLSSVDPTPDSLQASGATDWANLQERLHFIAELFRCFHTRNEIFDEAFTKEQVIAIKKGNLPVGSL